MKRDKALEEVLRDNAYRRELQGIRPLDDDEELTDLQTIYTRAAERDPSTCQDCGQDAHEGLALVAEVRRLREKNEALERAAEIRDDQLERAKACIADLKWDRRVMQRLLDLVTPHCSACCRPATRFEGTMYSTEKPTDPKRYACDEHAVDGIKWTDLPGAETIREAMKLKETGE